MRHRVVIIGLIVILVGLTAWITSIGKLGIYSTFTWGDILTDSRSHLQMVFIAVLIAIAIGVPLGILSVGAKRSNTLRVAL